MDWIWDKTDAGKPAIGGDIAKLFRHEEPKAPGVFGVDAPPAAATLLAREVIQNSWDAARDLQGDADNAPQFQIEFKFTELTGTAKNELVAALGLHSLASRVAEIDRGKVGLGERDCLDDLNSNIPLRMLEITERGASGMYGPWSQNRSHMYLALVSLGYTEKLSGAGGSYGFGKAGLVTGSRIRSVVAYTCFRERREEEGITRRLLGMTYWGPHDADGENYTGFGSLSAGRGGRIEPFTNDEADRIAQVLGLHLRDPAVMEQLGTTFLLIDPTVEPAELLRAIERSWWPALQENDFVATVVTYDGTTLYPRPKRDEVLRSFINAWELATEMRDKGDDEHFANVSGFGAYGVVGTFGLTAEMNGWSYSDSRAGPDDDQIDHKSMVALTRGPRMVVEYFVLGATEPYIRGAFVADPSIDDVLRRTEPKGHDSWQTKASDGELDADAAEVAKHVFDRLKQQYNNHRARLKPKPPPPEDLSLTVFSEIMRRVMSGMGAGLRQPVPETRPVSIHLDYAPRQAGDLIQIAGDASISLSDHFKGELAKVEVTIAYRFIEDERLGEFAELEIDPPPDMEEVKPGVFRGKLARDQEVKFSYLSETYDPNWTGRLIVNGEIMADLTETGADQ